MRAADGKTFYKKQNYAKRLCGQAWQEGGGRQESSRDEMKILRVDQEIYEHSTQGFILSRFA